MKLLFAAFVVVTLLSLVVKALDRYKLLEVVVTCTAITNRHHYDEAALERKERQCKRHHTQNGNDSGDEVCGSNGKKYKNRNEFNLHKCLRKVQEGTVMTVMDMEFCKNSKREDMEHVEDENDSSKPDTQLGN
ncbi:unnamed protein product [Peronospora destructor]|uniref:Kazal-like domain-containing protein n=1 Tax=Peronospora destructor TaxID=86335 RepID=A0AAV0V5E3_9STRA|nr:unnamed protein product [Peronospora destructor]